MTAPTPALAQDRETRPRPAQERDSVAHAFDVLGRSARIGVTVEELDADGRDVKAGVVVTIVTPEGPADKAGIRAGDAITEFDGERVRSVLHFSRLVQESAPGRSVAATLSRGGQRVTVNVTPQARSYTDDFGIRLLDTPRARMALPAMPAPPAPPAIASRFLPELMARAGRFGGLGITVENLDPQLAQYFGVKEGVLVKSVSLDSTAAKAGVKAGDVITSINGRHIYDSSDISRALDRVEASGELNLEVMRERTPQTLKGKLDAGEARGRTRVRTGV
ncbi:MAG: PDZ domain-containing protein [Vicinamibacterales bacterium]